MARSKNSPPPVRPPRYPEGYVVWNVRAPTPLDKDIRERAERDRRPLVCEIMARLELSLKEHARLP